MKAEVVNFKVDDGVKLDGLIYNYSDIKDSIIISTHGMGSNCFRNMVFIFLTYGNIIIFTL